MRFFGDASRVNARFSRLALAFGVSALTSCLFLLDCGGSAFTSGTEAVGGAQAGLGGADELGGAGLGSAGKGGQSGGPSSGGSPPAAGAGGVSDAGGPPSGGAGGDLPVSACPVAPPTGGTCVTGLSCTYGMDLRPACRTRFQCSKGVWTSDGTTCSPLLDCSTREGGIPQVGHECSEVGEDCTLNGGSTTGLIYCRCDTHATTQPVSTVWDCVGPPQKPCPKLAPNEGQACDGTSADVCRYGSCSMPPGYIEDLECVNHVITRIPAVCAAN